MCACVQVFPCIRVCVKSWAGRETNTFELRLYLKKDRQVLFMPIPSGIGGFLLKEVVRGDSDQGHPEGFVI